MAALAGFSGGRRVLLILDDVDRAPQDAAAFLNALDSAPSPDRGVRGRDPARLAPRRSAGRGRRG